VCIKYLLAILPEMFHDLSGRKPLHRIVWNAVQLI